MKFLTPIYSTLMHAFVERSDEIVEMMNRQNISRAYQMMEYRTLRLDGGRQSGKSTACAEFASDWIKDGGDVVYIGWNSDSCGNFKSMIKTASQRYWQRSEVVDLLRHKFTGVPSIRNFLSDAGHDRFRGMSMNKVLVIIDEPLDRMPNISKIYERYEETIRFCTNSTGNELPIFFVIGCQ